MSSNLDYNNGKKPAKGLQGFILDLIELGFFKGEKKIYDIQKKLEAEGHNYTQSSISPALIRLVRMHKLFRIKEQDGWLYFK